MRVFYLSTGLDEPGVRDRIAEIVSFADQREHWYRPPDGAVPGTDSRHSCRVGAVRCVYSVTVFPSKEPGLPGLVARHLSLSAPFGIPPTSIAYELASAFGFTGYAGDDKPGPGWDGWLDEDGPLTIANLIEPTGWAP